MESYLSFWADSGPMPVSTAPTEIYQMLLRWGKISDKTPLLYMECVCKHSTGAGDCSASQSALSSGRVVDTRIFWYRLIALLMLDTLKHGVTGPYPYGLQPEQIARDNAGEDLQGEVTYPVLHSS